MNEASGPRRYSVSFECGKEHIGTILDALVKEVEVPSTQPVDKDRHKIKFVCFLEQLPSIVTTIHEYVDRMIVAPDEPRPSEAMRPFMPKPTTPLYSQDQVRRFEPRKKQRMKHAPPSKDTASSRTGQIILELLKTRPIIHNPDAMDAFEQHGYNPTGCGATLSMLVREGVLIRHGRGSYRLPTDREREDLKERRRIQMGLPAEPAQEASDQEGPKNA